MEQKHCNACQHNQNECTCANVDCPRHGKCCECVAAHKAGGSVPNCMKHLVQK